MFVIEKKNLIHFWKRDDLDAADVLSAECPLDFNCTISSVIKSYTDIQLCKIILMG